MPLDLDKLENAKERGGKIDAACPACREVGSDTKGDNLAIFEGGAYHCIVDGSAEHDRRIWQLAGLDATDIPRPPPPPRKPVAVAVRPPPRLPRDIRRPTAAHLAQIVASRGWNMPGRTPDVLAALNELVARGLLFVGTVDDRGHPALCWIVSDGVTAEARRLDGQPFPGIGAKAYSLSQKDRPIVSIPANCTVVDLTEGLPDLLACCIALRLDGQDLARVGFLCVLGTGCKLGDAARLLDGKCLVIAEDADKSGREAADKWEKETYAAGCVSVESFTYAPGIKDFSDHLTALAKPAPAAPAPVTLAAPEKPAALTGPPPPTPAPLCRPLLVPLEATWIDGARYRLAGAHEIKNRLPLFYADPTGDTVRKHGVLMLVNA